MNMYFRFLVKKGDSYNVKHLKTSKNSENDKASRDDELHSDLL